MRDIYILFFLRNKVIVVLILALLASHMAETLIENLQKTLSVCQTNIFSLLII